MSNPEQFLPRLWATSGVGGCGVVHTGGQDVGLISSLLDLHPALESLLLVPDISLSEECLQGWMYVCSAQEQTNTHRQ